MLVRDMPETPTRAGDVALVFGSFEPGWVENTIYLSSHPEAHFIPLLGGRQFLYKSGGRGDAYVLWGGTDEQPFFVQMEPRVYSVLIQGGEEAFFGSLIPPRIRELEQRFGVQAVRQGDVVALRLPFSWEDFLTFTQLCSARIICFDSSHDPSHLPVPREVDSQLISDTLHKLKGRYLMTGGLYNRSEFGEGVIHSPNHGPMRLVGVHLLMKITGLYYNGPGLSRERK